MLESIKLYNFRQHRSLEVDLKPGLNVIRGSNESGKSTLLEAVGYLMYGAFALEEALDDTVTWGEPVSTLRVEVTFTFDGIEGKAYRGKSGAEAQYGDTLVSGQAEVTRFFEGLFRTTKQRALQLQIAKQGKVRGAVEDSSAVELIEQLGEFDQLDALIDRIQRHRPCGNTKLVADRVARLGDAFKALDEARPGPPSAGNLDRARQAALDAKTAAEAFQPVVSAALEAANEAREWQKLAEKRQAAINDTQRDLDRALVDASIELLEPEVSEGQIEEWRNAVANIQHMAQLRKLRGKKIPQAPFEWVGTRQSFLETVQTEKRELELLTKTINEQQINRAQLVVLKINEDTCTFCKKVIKDLPEVAAKNAEVDAAVKAIDDGLLQLNARVQELKEKADAYAALQGVDDKIQREFNIAPWKLDTSLIPAVPTWDASEPAAEGEELDYASLIQQAQSAWAVYRAKVESRTRAKMAAERLTAELKDLPKPPDTSGCAAALAAAEDAQERQRLLERAALESQHAHKLEEASYNAAAEAYGAAVVAVVKAEEEWKLAKEELATTEFFNGLLRKIQVARPKVANALWGLVLSGVSHYVTNGRGSPTAVTREGKNFHLNGRPLSSYSGSAKDVLGLGVRLALLNTFLPGNPLLVLDEPASACDDDRELALLGMVLEAGIPQVLLVTHSDAAESFASHLIQIGTSN